MLRERRPHRCFGAEANERSYRAATVIAGRGIAGCLIPDRAVALRRPRAGALVEEIAAARLPLALNPKGRRRVRTQRVRTRRPLDVTQPMKPKKRLAACA